MGKPYAVEMNELARTYEHASQTCIDDLVHFLGASHQLPLLVAGSGGSLTAAHFAALLHERRGSFAKAVTPMELRSAGHFVRDASVLMISAGGRNSDVLAGFEATALREPRHLLALTAHAESPLSKLAASFRYTGYLGYELPSGKDGFLATNSLLAFMALLLRAHAKLAQEPGMVPAELPDAGQRRISESSAASGILERDTLIVLHGGWGLPAAVDLESKLTEAALGQVQMADYRNFAHGRHHWLDKRGASTGVVALVTPGEQDIARRTLRLLPDGVPTLELSTEDAGPAAALDLVVQVFRLTQAFGEVRGIDPGRPGVPEFGRRIYGLKPARPRPDAPCGLRADVAAAISRKVTPLTLEALEATEFQRWVGAHVEYLRTLRAAAFGAVVFDYDGTLCDAHEKRTGPCAAVGEHLVRLLEAGVAVGIATGRGKSVRRDLQRLVPEALWPQVLVGYYNGADVATLSDDERPLTGPPEPALQGIAEWMAKHPTLGRIAAYEVRPRQITVEPRDPVAWAQAKLVLAEALRRDDAAGVRIVESSHSIDIIAPGVTKLAVAEACAQAAGGRAVLRVGDRGAWPGNDYDLLAGPHSLSVDSVSPDSGSCWNLCPPGFRGVQGTLAMLERITVAGGGFRFR